MSTSWFCRRATPLFAIGLMLATVACSRDASARKGPTTATVATAAPVYPGSHLEAGSAFASSDSFETVYGWYKKNLPQGSERRHTSTPRNAAVFVFGTGNDRLGVTIEAAPPCCKTLIVIGRVKA